jgi:hypothetical protein
MIGVVPKERLVSYPSPASSMIGVVPKERVSSGRVQACKAKQPKTMVITFFILWPRKRKKDVMADNSEQDQKAEIVMSLLKNEGSRGHV